MRHLGSTLNVVSDLIKKKKRVQSSTLRAEFLQILDNLICDAFWVALCCTFDRELHSYVHITQVSLAAVDYLVCGRRGLAGHRALF